MKIIVTASRTWDDGDKIWRVLTALAIMAEGQDVEVVHGGARGGDKLASEWVRKWQEWDINPPPAFLSQRFGKVTEKVYPVTDEQWRTSRAAGLHRNVRMVAENRDADLVTAFSREGSRGTAHCVGQAREWGLPVWFIDYDLDIPNQPNPSPSWWPAKGI